MFLFYYAHRNGSYVNELVYIAGKYTDSDLVKEPMKLLRGYPYAEQLLGKPIRNTRIKFNTVDIAHTPLTAQVIIFS